MKDLARPVHVPEPPGSPKRPAIDDVHGTLIEDPYRWLEDGKSAETAAWTQAQNSRTDEVFRQLPEKESLARQLADLVSRDSVGSPIFRGHRLFYTRRTAGANQPVLCVVGLAGASSERVLVDPNRMDEKGLVALDWWKPSDDGSMLAFGCSERGDEWSVLRVLDVEGGETLPDRIERTRMAGVNWEKDNGGFYYSRYPKPGEVPPGEENYNRHLFHHRLGDDAASDPKVFGEGRPKEEMFNTSFSSDGKCLLLTVGHGWNSTDLYVRDETAPGSPFSPIIVGEQAIFHGRIVGDTLYVLTNYRAPRYRLCAVDLSRPGLQDWQDLIPEDPGLTITSFVLSSDSIVVTGLRDAVARLYVYDMGGGSKREIPLPMPGAIGDITGQATSPEVFFEFESFVRAPAIYRLCVGGSVSPETFLRSAQPEGADSIITDQVFYRSKDGTVVPMFILQERAPRQRAVAAGASGSADDPGAPGTGPRPTLLTGYGGFNLARTPGYSPTIIPWLTSGGIYAVANLRGGNEYGEEWHKAGMLGNKQNVFDDFIAAAEYLVREGYTDRAHLGIWGRSNGGLLVGAAMTQRPELFSAVSCGVPLLDMVRYHKFLIAYIWSSEYGNADDREAFRWLYAYSPYHRVRDEVAYPPVYFYAAQSDSRVDPMHARKMAARLQEVQVKVGSENPVLLRIESDAGHGVGKPLRKVVDEQAEMWAFLAWRLGLRTR